MERTVSAQLALRVDDDATLAFIVAVAGRPATERLELRHDGVLLQPREVTDAAGTRIHVVDVGAGALTLDYAATVEGRAERHPPPSSSGSSSCGRAATARPTGSPRPRAPSSPASRAPTCSRP